MPAAEKNLPVGIKKTSVVVVVLLTGITGGIYIPIWFLTRRNAINALDSEEKLGKGIFILAAVVFTGIAVGSAYLQVQEIIGPVFSTNRELVIAALELLLNVISLVVFIPVIYEAFKVKRILEDHFNNRFPGKGIHLSKLWTFLLMNIYLQHKINRLEAPDPDL